MSFALQLGHPKILRGPFSVESSVSEAFAQLFRPVEESVYLFWRDVPVRIRYKQDLPRCFDDILAMVWLMQRDDEGATEVTLETQLVSIRWEVRWLQDDCHLHAAFSERFAPYAPYADALNRLSDIAVSRSAFLSEWKTLLHQLIVSIEAGNVQIRDGVERRKWEMLQRVERGIAGYGEIYTRTA